MLGIGDIHCRIDNVEKVLKKYKGELKIFVGDSIDSYKRPDIDGVNTVKALIYSNPSENILLAGNHEFNYCGIYADDYKQKLGTPDEKKGAFCRGFRKSYFNELYDLFNENKERFRLAYFDEKSRTLFTHAGVIPGWIEFMKHFNDMFDLEKIIKYLCRTNPFDIKNPSHPLFEYGYRGTGNESSLIAGPLWCDYNREFKPLLGINQVFGHSPNDKICEFISPYSQNYMIDCLEWGKQQVLEIDRGKFRILEI